jgi:hypothetical protein
LLGISLNIFLGKRDSIFSLVRFFFFYHSQHTSTGTMTNRLGTIASRNITQIATSAGATSMCLSCPGQLRSCLWLAAVFRTTAILAPEIGDSSKIRAIFPHLTELDLPRSDLGWSLFKHLGFSSWSTSTKVKKLILHGSNGVPWGDQVEGFPKNEQNCLVESQGLTDLSNVSLKCFCLKMASSGLRIHLD